MHWWWWWVSVTPAQVISIMLAPIPWTRHMALTKYIIFGTHFPNISGFAAAICGPAEAELSSGVCLHHGYADLIADS